MTGKTIEFDEGFLLAMEGHRHSAAARAKFERYLSLAGPLTGARLLDLGCGSGAHTRLLAARVAPDGVVVGVDLSPDAIALAQRLAAGSQLETISFQVADAHRLPFESASFDVVVCISVLAFCRDPLQVLGEARRVLRPGGRLLLASSDEDTRIFNSHDRDLGRRVLRAIADRADDPWCGRRMAGLMAAAGFVIIREEVVAEMEREFKAGMSGYVLAHAFRAHLLKAGGLTVEDYERWLKDLEACNQDGSYLYSVTTFSYVGVR